MNIQLKISIPKMMPKGFKKVNITSARELLVPDKSEFESYMVKKGDTIQSIAEKYNLDPFEFADFVRENEGSETLYDGLELEIPILSNSKDEKERQK